MAAPESFTRAAQAPDRDDPAGAVPAAAAGSLSIQLTCSPAVALVLRLVEAARPDLSRDEIFAVGCSAWAERIGLPVLADQLEASRR